MVGHKEVGPRGYPGAMHRPPSHMANCICMVGPQVGVCQAVSRSMGFDPPSMPPRCIAFLPVPPPPPPALSVHRRCSGPTVPSVPKALENFVHGNRQALRPPPHLLVYIVARGCG